MLSIVSMQHPDDKTRLASEIKNAKYIDSYIEKWLNLKTVDKPYVECEICGYVSNASIHQHLLIPKEFGYVPHAGNNRILHLCANCYSELRALIDKFSRISTFEHISQVCEEAFEKLLEMKKSHRDVYQKLERIVI